MSPEGLPVGRGRAGESVHQAGGQSQYPSLGVGEFGERGGQPAVPLLGVGDQRFPARVGQVEHGFPAVAFTGPADDQTLPLGAGLAATRITHQPPGAVVFGLLIGMSLGRTYQAKTLADRAIGLVVISIVAAIAGELGHLVAGRFAVLGCVALVVALSATVWVRRFGPRATRLGTLATAPLLSVLFVPTGPGTQVGPLPSGVLAGVVFMLVSLLHLIAGLTGFQRTQPVRTESRPAAKGLPTSTKQALQLAVALAAACAIAQIVLPTHWQWVVLTAFIVCSGNRGRGDVLRKSALRVFGASVGTMLATGLLALVTPEGVGWVVAILGVLTAGIVLRPVSYAYWAGCLTAAMALLLGLFGADPVPQLLIRLAAILLGGALGVAASWLVLPIGSREVADRRIAEVRRALDALDAAQPHQIADARRAVHGTIAQLDLIAPTFDLQRRLYRLRPGDHPRTRQLHADTFDALRAVARTAVGTTANEQSGQPPSRRG